MGSLSSTRRLPGTVLFYIVPGCECERGRSFDVLWPALKHWQFVRGELLPSPQGSRFRPQLPPSYLGARKAEIDGRVDVLWPLKLHKNFNWLFEALSLG